MSAMFAFEVGDISMRSMTFEYVINDLLERSSDPIDQQVCQVALDLNCLWVDQINAGRKCALLGNLHDVLVEQLRSGVHSDNWVALFEIRRALDELAKRYPDCFK
ncbi:hypothetical protein [Nonomuraea jiangxiensis]|uniref:Uncharacterized protein n=1 Tax=Nonomuraea jiangxiensis TaxID=633440 RepID=A0A1G8PUB0_9ACTN|nr:hypothetical protein [Nonomuraea jiangxiensis]SDI95805.1 hypothetical protein SAMN05421869_10824 [Nonomuraea jiangxiensis]